MTVKLNFNFTRPHAITYPIRLLLYLVYDDISGHYFVPFQSFQINFSRVAKIRKVFTKRIYLFDSDCFDGTITECSSKCPDEEETEALR